MLKIFQVLLLGGLFYSFNTFAIEKKTESKLILEDTLIFMIKDQVYSLSDLGQIQQGLEDFDCIYPGAFLPEHFKLLTRKFDKRLLNKDYLVKNAKSKKVQVYLDEFLKFVKISIYAKEQAVSITSELKRAIKLSAQTRKCSLKFFQGDQMMSPLESALSVEVFFRSRNVLDSEREMTKKERKNILKSLNSLSRSIINQITHNQFELVRTN